MSDVIEVLEPEVVGSQLAEVERSAGVAGDTALALRGQFADYYNNIVTLRETAVQVTDPTNAVHQKIARTVRLGLKKVRCEVEATRKTLKADSLARGKAIDGFANVLKYLCEPIEEKLAAVEQYAERQEAARIAALVAERTASLVAVECDPTPYNLSVMDDATFALVLAGAKKQREERIEAERKAEADRIAREQADRIAREKADADAKAAREEAEKARKAQAAAEAKAEKERKAAAAKAREIEEKARAEREAAEAAARKAKAEADAKLRAEREAAEARERELREAREKAEREFAAVQQREADRVASEKEAAAAKAKAQREAAEKAARAPDRDKIMRFAVAVRSLVNDVPEMKTDAGLVVTAAIVPQVERFANWIEQQAETL